MNVFQNITQAVLSHRQGAIKVPARLPQILLSPSKEWSPCDEALSLLLTNEAINDTFRWNIYEEAIYLFTVLFVPF